MFSTTVPTTDATEHKRPQMFGAAPSRSSTADEMPPNKSSTPDWKSASPKIVSNADPMSSSTDRTSALIVSNVPENSPRPLTIDPMADLNPADMFAAPAK